MPTPDENSLMILNKNLEIPDTKFSGKKKKKKKKKKRKKKKKKRKRRKKGSLQNNINEVQVGLK